MKNMPLQRERRTLKKITCGRLARHQSLGASHYGMLRKEIVKNVINHLRYSLNEHMENVLLLPRVEQVRYLFIKMNCDGLLHQVFL